MLPSKELSKEAIMPRRNQTYLMLVGYFPNFSDARVKWATQNWFSLKHLLPSDQVLCALCVQTITGHLTVN